MYKRLLAIVALSVVSIYVQTADQERCSSSNSNIVKLAALLEALQIIKDMESNNSNSSHTGGHANFTEGTDRRMGLDGLHLNPGWQQKWYRLLYEEEARFALQVKLQDNKRRMWVQKVLDEEIPWNDRFRDWDDKWYDPLELAIPICDDALVASVLAHEEGRALINTGRSLHLSCVLGTRKSKKLLLNEPTFDCNQRIGFSKEPAIIYAIGYNDIAMIYQLLGDARLTLLDENECNKPGISARDILKASIHRHMSTGREVQAFMVALVNRKDFRGIKDACFNTPTILTMADQYSLEQEWLEAPSICERLLQKKEFLQEKRQELKKRKTKIQKLFCEQKLFNTLRAQIVDSKEQFPDKEDKDVVFDDFCALIVGGKCATSKQTKFKTCVGLALKQFALLRDLSAYDLQEND